MGRPWRAPARRIAGRTDPFNKKPRGGFTMVEVLTALVIFSVAAFALMEGFTQAVHTQGNLMVRQRAEMIAENILEEIRYTGDVTEGEAEGIFDEGEFKGYDWWTGISPTSVEGLMQVRVIVSWVGGGATHDIELVTLIARGAS